MNPACGQFEFVSGGTIQGSTILNSQITNSTITGSTISGSTIENLVGIDAASLQTIINGLIALPSTQLTALVEALLASIVTTPMLPPIETVQPELPTTILGDRSQLLGKPFMFVKLGPFIIPVYQEGM